MENYTNIKILIACTEDFLAVQGVLFDKNSKISWGDNNQRNRRSHHLLGLFVASSGRMTTTNDERHFKNYPSPQYFLEDGKLIPMSSESLTPGTGSVSERVLGDVLLSRKYAKKAASCREKIMPFDLTYEEFVKLATQESCAYSNLKFPSLREVTLERVNPRLGYTSGNTIAVSDKMNQLKNKVFDRPYSFFPDVDIKDFILDSLEVYSKVCLQLGLRLVLTEDGIIEEELPSDVILSESKLIAAGLGDHVILLDHARTSDTRNFNRGSKITQTTLLANGDISYRLTTTGNLSKTFRETDFCRDSSYDREKPTIS